VLSLHLLQSSLVYVNTLMLQRVPRKPAWMMSMATNDCAA
jgi:TnpA family transposase